MKRDATVRGTSTGIYGVHHLLDVRIKRGRNRRCVQQFFVEPLLYRLSRFLMRPFLSQRTPWFRLPMPVSVEPTCGLIAVRGLTNLAGKSGMNGWAWSWMSGERSEPSSEEI